jgi:hypothetical protein
VNLDNFPADQSRGIETALAKYLGKNRRWIVSIIEGVVSLLRHPNIDYSYGIVADWVREMNYEATRRILDGSQLLVDLVEHVDRDATQSQADHDRHLELPSVARAVQ